MSGSTPCVRPDFPPPPAAGGNGVTVTIDSLLIRIRGIICAALLAITSLAAPQALAQESEWEDPRPVEVRQVESVRHGHLRVDRDGARLTPSPKTTCRLLRSNAQCPVASEHLRRDRRHGRGLNLRT